MRTLALLIASLILALPAAAQMPPAPEYIRVEAERGVLSGGARAMSDHSGYSGQGFVAGFEGLGASVGVDAAVPASGKARLTVRYSAGWGAQTLGLYVDGQKLLDLRLAGTNGWDDWATATAELQLAAGIRKIEIRRDRPDTGTINIDWVAIATAPGAAPPPMPGTLKPAQTAYEAEDGALGGTAKIAFDHSGFSGKGFVAGFENLGAWVRATIAVPASGPAIIAIRYSAGWGDQTLGLYIDGQKTADLRFPGTPGWDDWGTLTAAVQLSAGVHGIEIRRDRPDTGTINIDWISLPGAAAGPTSGGAAGGVTPSGGNTGPGTSAGGGPKPPAALPARVVLEAELGLLGGGAKVMTDHSGYTGLGFVAGFGELGASVRFGLPAPSAGLATVEIRYSAGFGDETVGLYVDGAKAADLRCARTAGWDAWGTSSATIPLTQGMHLVEIRRDRPDTGLINIDSIALR